MRQELVFIGQGLEQEQVIQRLQECLLTEEQTQQGPESWQQLPDPFPIWQEV